ncbi:MAG TPA: glucose 1-dehydrogenase [Thermodesulfobacteriota bacterium]|nr:glucose 1-dehydrogenase [Thermodesulfobacteriota bacterium]
MNRVLGKVGIVTGGGGAIGRAIALLLAQEGAKVTISDTDEVRGKRVAEEIKGGGGEALFVKHDVTREGDWKEVVRTTLGRFGKLDILVNNAGVMLWKNIENTSLEEWRWLMGVNLEGVFLGTKHAMESMKPTGGGSIVNISSVAGLVGTLDTSAYHASKGGVRLFSKAAAFECSKAGYNYNIRVNSVHPGVIKTPMVEELFKDEEKTKAALSWHLVGRFGEPEDVAYGVLYLASDESKFVTGAELVIDGGWTAH